MSYSFKCDICGKIESEDVKFDDRPLLLQIPNKKGEPYNVCLELHIELAEDTQTITDYHRNRQNNPLILMLSGSSNESNELQQLNQPPVQLKNPEPHICIKCMMELIKLTKDYGSFEKFRKLSDVI